MLFKAIRRHTPFNRAFAKQVFKRRIGHIASVFLLSAVVMFVAASAGAASYSVLYSFVKPRGAQPEANLLDVDGTLYGTTAYGGASNAGTVFSLGLNGEHVIHSFANFSDGAVPAAGLIQVAGKLYGTTSQGGPGGFGTIFSIDLGNTAESIVYAFQGNGDGNHPFGSLIFVNGVLYGTTAQGGASTNCLGGCGTVFSLDLATGAKATLHSFGGGADGAYPLASLLDVGNTLYGTTQKGGATGCFLDFGCGTVFAIDPATGVEKVVYSFVGNNDGAFPSAGLIEVGPMLYGTTEEGGGCTMEGGCGTVFSLDPTAGAEKVVYKFRGEHDGQYPVATLLAVNGILYGTTYSGGVRTCSFYGCGTVFAVYPTTGAEKIVHAFLGSSDGSEPKAGLIDVNGTLLGTTPFDAIDGCYRTGCGTVFSISHKLVTTYQAILK